MANINANQNKITYSYQQVEAQYQCDCTPCRHEGFINLLGLWGVIDTTTHYVKEEWLHIVYKQVEGEFLPVTPQTEQIRIQDAFFSDESAKELVNFISGRLMDYVNGNE